VSSSTTRLIPLLGLTPREEVQEEQERSKSVQWETGQSSAVVADVPEALGSVSDEELIFFFSRGESDALSQLFRRYARLVRSVAYKILRDGFEADDLLQEVFILVHGKASSFDASKASVRFWLLQMTYHRAITRRRYLACRHFYSSLDLEEAVEQLVDSRNETERLERDLDGAVRNSALQKLMAGLSDNQQKTLRLYFFEGYTLDEIAIELGQTKDNVRHHYFRGLDKLGKQIFRQRSRR
jgi:RNA polymerase sigma-70 factor, ECF subfamily